MELGPNFELLSWLFFFKANIISISTSLKLIMWTLQSWPSSLIQLLSSNLTISIASLGSEGVSTFWGIPLTWGMHGMGRHHPAEPKRNCAKTETALIKYSLERGALGSQREGAALGAGGGRMRMGMKNLIVGENKFRIEESCFRRFP